MRVIVRIELELRPELQETVILVPTNWDDYSLRTEFTVYYAAPQSAPVAIGLVKILAASYKERVDGKKYTLDMLPGEGGDLDPRLFCSVGQDGWYYRRLGGLGASVGSRILSAINDVCFSDNRDAWWLNDRNYEGSLLRTASAKIACRESRGLFAGKELETEDRNHLFYSRSNGGVEGGPNAFEVRFDGTLQVPGRLCVVVGKNGVGKTSLLAGLASWFSRSLPNDQWSYRPKFSRVVVLAYNPFDDLIRGESGVDANVRLLGRRPPSLKLQRFVDLIAERIGSTSDLPPEDWKAMLDRAFPTPRDFVDSLGTISFDATPEAAWKSLVANPAWEEFLGVALDEPHITRKLLRDRERAFDAMSAGQRALVNLWASMFCNLAPESLVLIDEPENFLHPSLVARFARSLNELLSVRKSFAVVASHSPILAQETPSRFVFVLERQDDETTVRHPNFETFGESIDNLTERLFGTDFRSSHWKRVLREFADNGDLSLEEVGRQVSGMPLPMLAQTYFLYQKELRKKS